jgi:diadenosine tetraphosphatase ApaH/serine/threonine PP2A family protein phosphatase
VFHEGHARDVFNDSTAPFILYGHTHLPVIFSIDRTHRVQGVAIRGDIVVRLDHDHRYLINPGSVGQPRDRNPEASFVIFDSKRLTVQFFRVAYDVAKTQASILRAGLPEILAQRLAYGT